MHDLETPEQRIERARKTLSGWGWMAVVSTRPDEVVGYLRLEITVLGALALEDPRHAPEILTLIEQFQALIDKIQSQRSQPDLVEAPSQRARTA